MSVLITNRKSHTGFQLVPTSMTLNDLEHVIALILFHFTEFVDLQDSYITVVEDRPILSAEFGHD